MKRERKQVSLTLRVFTSAMHWYDKNVAAGCVRESFSGQLRQLWIACKCLRDAERESQEKGWQKDRM